MPVHHASRAAANPGMEKALDHARLRSTCINARTHWISAPRWGRSRGSWAPTSQTGGPPPSASSKIEISRAGPGEDALIAAQARQWSPAPSGFSFAGRTMSIVGGR